jgi:hypothetical protein
MTVVHCMYGSCSHHKSLGLQRHLTNAFITCLLHVSNIVVVYCGIIYSPFQ